MKLAVCIIHNRDKNRIIDELVEAGFKFTIIGSTGGFLREGNTTFLIGVQDAEIASLKSLISVNCQSREQILNVSPFETNPTAAFAPSAVKVPVGGAVLFLLPVEEFERF
ncbi:MAG: cyclic-di-AMP receptor [Armatimonadota bacterium]